MAENAGKGQAAKVLPPTWGETWWGRRTGMLSPYGSSVVLRINPTSGAAQLAALDSDEWVYLPEWGQANEWERNGAAWLSARSEWMVRLHQAPQGHVSALPEQRLADWLSTRPEVSFFLNAPASTNDEDIKKQAESLRRGLSASLENGLLTGPEFAPLSHTPALNAPLADWAEFASRVPTDYLISETPDGASMLARTNVAMGRMSAAPEGAQGIRDDVLPRLAQAAQCAVANDAKGVRAACEGAAQSLRAVRAERMRRGLGQDAVAEFCSNVLPSIEFIDTDRTREPPEVEDAIHDLALQTLRPPGVAQVDWATNANCVAWSEGSNDLFTTITIDLDNECMALARGSAAGALTECRKFEALPELVDALREQVADGRLKPATLAAGLDESTLDGP